MTKLMSLKEKIIEVLIVEEELVFALSIEESLQNVGYKVSSLTSSATTAIKQVKEYCPDVVIMNIDLKYKKAGVSLSKILWDEFQIPVVFLSSLEDLSFQKEIKNRPYSYLNKICDKKSLDISIKTVLHKHKYFFKNNECINDDDIIILAKNYIYNKTKKLLYKNDLLINLDKNELEFFEVLTLNIKESFCFDRIISSIYKYEYSDVKKLKSLVTNLKNKLEDEIFEDIKDFGYRLKPM